VADHGGRVSLVGVQEGRVFLRFGGGCQGCGMVDVTLKEGIQGQLMAEIPEITEVLDATDHASGTNPYYEPGH
jgi:Fe/S biogenesis protein NfuA